MKQCPKCEERLPVKLITHLFVSDTLKCPNCGSELRLAGFFSFMMWIGLALVSLIAYGAIENPLVQILALLALGVLVAAIEFRYSKLEVLP